MGTPHRMSSGEGDDFISSPLGSVGLAEGDVTRPPRNASGMCCGRTLLGYGGTLLGYGETLLGMVSSYLHVRQPFGTCGSLLHGEQEADGGIFPSCLNLKLIFWGLTGLRCIFFFTSCAHTSKPRVRSWGAAPGALISQCLQPAQHHGLVKRCHPASVLHRHVVVGLQCLLWVHKTLGDQAQS